MKSKEEAKNASQGLNIVLEEISPQDDPIGAVLFARMKLNKNELSATTVITLVDATKKKLPLFGTPKLTLG